MTRFWVQVPQDGSPVFFKSSTDDEHGLALGVTSCFEISQECYDRADSPWTGVKNYSTG